jgi:ATP-dependent Clp protease ATP-binding subunit ClpA
MGSPKERQPGLTYDNKAKQTLIFAYHMARSSHKELVNFRHLAQAINDQIPSQEKPNLYKTTYDELDIRSNVSMTVVSELLEISQLEDDIGSETIIPFSPRVKKVIQYAEELANLKENKTLDVYDLFRGMAKVADDEHKAQLAEYQDTIL